MPSNLDLGEAELIFPPPSFGAFSPRAIAVDSAAGKLYLSGSLFFDPAPGGFRGVIYRANLDGSGLEPLITTGLDFPWGIALDPDDGRMY